MMISLTRIVNLSERCFSSTPDVVVVSVELKPNLSSRNFHLFYGTRQGLLEAGIYQSNAHDVFRSAFVQLLGKKL